MKPFLLADSYRNYLDIKELNKRAKAFNKRIASIKKKNEIERKKLFVSRAVIHVNAKTGWLI